MLALARCWMRFHQNSVRTSESRHPNALVTACSVMLRIDSTSYDLMALYKYAYYAYYYYYYSSMSVRIDCIGIICWAYNVRACTFTVICVEFCVFLCCWVFFPVSVLIGRLAAKNASEVSKLCGVCRSKLARSFLHHLDVMQTCRLWFCVPATNLLEGIPFHSALYDSCRFCTSISLIFKKRIHLFSSCSLLLNICLAKVDVNVG